MPFLFSWDQPAAGWLRRRFCSLESAADRRASLLQQLKKSAKTIYPQNLVLLTGAARSDGTRWSLVLINQGEKVPVGREGAGQWGWRGMSLAWDSVIIIDAQVVWGLLASSCRGGN